MAEQFDNQYAEHHAAPKLIDLAEHNKAPKVSIAAAPDTVAAAPAPPAPAVVIPAAHASSKVAIERYLQQTVDMEASDLHVKAGAPPTVRSGGHLKMLSDTKLVPSECDEMAMALLGDKELLTLDEYGEVDFAYTQPGTGRFRVNVHRHRGSLGIAARRILDNVPEFNDLLLPPAVEKLAGEHRGLLLVTGPTSSGKTTTCGAVIRHINKTRACHIVTIEDPIEILHDDEQSVVTQREVGDDTKSFDRALRAAMRQDPDVIFVGEIRDLETMQAALQAAETGHMVIATLHTTDAVETINRIVDFFPPFQHNQVRSALAASLLGVVTQRLLPKIGGGRVPAIEIMLMTGRIKDCILDADKTLEIHDLIAESNYYGMQTFDQSLVGLFKDGHATLEDATDAAMSPHDFQLVLKKSGVLDT
jgi:twitching motility protein PilT